MNLLESFNNWYFLLEGKQDIDNFINTFGQERLDKLNSLKNRLKNLKDENDKPYNFTYSYLVKNVSPEKLDQLFNRAERKEYSAGVQLDIENNPIPKPEGKARLVVNDEENNVKMYAIPKDAIGDLIKFGEGSEWCITGRHDTNGKIKVSQAIDSLKDIRPKDNLFYVIFTPNEKYCMHIEYHEKFYIRNSEDNEVKKIKLFEISPKIAEYFNIKDYSKTVYIYTGGKDAPEDVINVKVKDGIESIKAWAFFGCADLQSITIPDSVISIEGHAFSDCSSLKSIKIPEGVTNIEESTFDKCFKLQSVNIPEGVIDIGDSAFSMCKSLQSIDIPNSVTSIGYYAFEYCSNLKSITIPDRVTDIWDCAFYGCVNLQSINIPEGVTSIGDDAFYGCKSLQSITIPNSVKNIGHAAFKKCKNLKNINAPDNIKQTILKQINQKE